MTARRINPQRLERTTFESSRAGEYFDARQLSALSGVPQHEFASVCLKELIDNALDACETVRVAPDVGVAVQREEEGMLRLSVSDNGPGIPPEVVRKVLDYSIRVSDKAAYRSPTRGAQGNALKTIIGIPYALGSREPTVVEARGVRHMISPWVDPAGEVHISHTEVPAGDASIVGTRVSLTIPEGEQDFHPLHWVRSFAAFNPHATISYQESFCYQGKTYLQEEGEMYKSTRGLPFKKYVPSEPTSPHWYSAATLQTLVFSYIANARNGGRDLPLGEFVREFQGLSRTSKAKAICSELPAVKHLSDFEETPDAVGELLARMQEASKPPKHTALGFVGEDHFRTFFESVYSEAVKEVKYTRKQGILPSGLPLVFEFALATLDRPGHLYTAINFSPTFGDPLEGTTLAGPKFKAHGISGFLSQGHALPRSDRAWYYSPASVAVAAHIATPAPIFLDRGKTRLNMEGS